MAGSSDYMRNYRTPKSNKRPRKSSTSSRFASGVDTLAQMAANAAGYGKHYKVAKLSMGAAKRLFTKNQTSNKSNSKVSYVKKGGSSGVLAGKLRRKGKKVNRNYNALQQKGILTREEFRFQDDISTANESRLVGHTSLPIRATYYNVFRALVKCLLGKAGITVQALTDLTPTKGNFQFTYFTDWNTGTISTSVYAIPGPGALSWRAIADGLADWFLSFGSAGRDPGTIRWKTCEYRPNLSYSSEDPSKVVVDLGQAFVTIKSKSILKVQNQSGVYKGITEAEKEATTDDVDNVPVELSTYYVTGNQFIHQNARTSATLGLGFLGFNQTFLNSTPGSEPPPAYEILNCTNRVKITMDPGHVKSSIISYHKTMTFGSVIRLLVRRSISGNWDFNDTSYVKAAGHSRALHVDRVIGASLGKVRLMGECELKQQVMMSANRNTATDQYEVQN